MQFGECLLALLPHVVLQLLQLQLDLPVVPFLLGLSPPPQTNEQKEDKDNDEAGNGSNGPDWRCLERGAVLQKTQFRSDIADSDSHQRGTSNGDT